MPAAAAIVRDNLCFHLERAVDVAARAGLPVEARAAATQSVCENLRRLGILALLAEGDAGDFSAFLHQSGHAYLALLRSAPASDVCDGYFLCASRAQGFLDAVVSGDAQLAAAIAVTSRQEPVPGDEYLEDFAFMRALMALALRDPSAARRWADVHAAEAADGDTRHDLLSALVHVDADAFEGALSAYARSWATSAERSAREVGVTGEWLGTERHVSVEGLAIAKFAESVGLPSADPLPGLPRLARLARARTWPPPDAWMRPPTVREAND